MATGRINGTPETNSDLDNQNDKVPSTSKDVEGAQSPIASSLLTTSVSSLGSPSPTNQILERKSSGSYYSPSSNTKAEMANHRYSPRLSLNRAPSSSKSSKSSPLRVPSASVGFPPPLLDSVISVTLPTRPVESRSIKDYVNLEKLKHESGHVVSKVVAVSDEEVQIGYLKQNAPGSFISQLEAMCAAFYRFIAPDHAPEVYALYEEKDGAKIYTGVVSHELPGFKSAAADPLKDEDLYVDHLADRNLFPTVDSVDGALRRLEKSAEAIHRKLKKLEQNAADFAPTTPDIEILKKKFRANAEMPLQSLSELADNTKRQHEYYHNLAIDHAVSKTEFERYRIVKGLAIGLTASYIFVEVDLHQNNKSKDGKRIDFDMSLWHLFWEFKDSRIIDFFGSRKPAKNVLDVTRNDLRDFPDLKDVTPYYWPTTSDTILSEAQREFIKNFIPFAADNPYSSEANTRYKKLSKNKVFTYHKFATLLKYVLTRADTFRDIGQLHLSKDSYSQSKPLLEVVVLSQAQRIQVIKDRLLTMPEFSAFMTEYGDDVFEHIKASFQELNEDNQIKVAELEDELAELQSQHEGISEVNENLLSKSTEALPSAPIQIIADYNSNLSTIDTRELKQAREEQRIQFEMFEKNEQKLKNIVDVIDRTEAKIAAYNRQKIDLEYVALMYKNISERSKAGGEKAPLNVQVERSSSVNSNVTTPVSTPTPVRSATNNINLTPSTPKIVHTNASTVVSTFSTATSSLAKVSVLGYFNLGYFSKSTATLVQPIAPKPNDFQAVQQRVLKLLHDYINPGFFGLGGYNRSNIPEAQQLETFFANLKVEPTDLAANIAAIAEVKKKLQELKIQLEAKAQGRLEAKLKERANTKSEVDPKLEIKLEPGELLNQVNNFLNDEIWKIQDKQSHTPLLATNSS